MARPLIDRAIDIVEKRFRHNTPNVLVIEAPTGYGKTVAGPMIFKTLVDLGMCYSFIHSLPLRAIVRDYYLCTLLRASVLGSSIDIDAEIASLCNGGTNEVLLEISRVLKDLGIDYSMIAYQMGERLEHILGVSGLIHKEAFFDARYVVTTIDSFVYNLFRVPVAEIFSDRKHYAIPRLRIFLSTVYLDEAHMVFEESEDVSPMFTSITEALKVLQQMRTPIVLASATLAPKHIEFLRTSVKGIHIVRLSKYDREENGVVEVSDHDFIDAAASIDWRTGFVFDKDVVSKTIELLNSGFRVFVACDTVANAIQRYREITEHINESDAVLIHGLMMRGDREEALNKLRKARVLIATSVVEAGVNISFDVLVSDGSRIPSIIQRVGRVCRDLRCGTAMVFLVRDRSLDSVVDFVDKVHSEGKEICWRLPIDVEKYVGYGRLLEVVNVPSIDGKLSKALLSLYAPLFVGKDTVDAILRNLDYALTRISLVEAMIGDLEEVRNWSYVDVIRHSLPLTVRHINRLLMKRCIDGVVVVYGSNGVEDVRIVCTVNDVVDRRGSFSITKHIECMKKIFRSGRETQFVGLLIKKSCYARNQGLIL